MAFQTECKMSHKILSLNNWGLRESKAKYAKLSLGIFTSRKQKLKTQKTLQILQNPINFTASSINWTYFIKLPDSFWFDSKLPQHNKSYEELCIQKSERRRFWVLFFFFLFVLFCLSKLSKKSKWHRIFLCSCSSRLYHWSCDFKLMFLPAFLFWTASCLPKCWIL